MPGRPISRPGQTGAEPFRPSDSITADRAIFSAATTSIPSLAADRSILGMDFTASAGGATLTSAAGVILTLGASGIDATGQLPLSSNTVSVANLKIGADQTWTLFSNTSNTTSNPTTFSVSSNIDLNGQNLTVTPNRSGTSSSRATVTNSTLELVGATIQANGFGQGSVGITGTGGLTKDGVGTLTLSSINSYNGDTHRFRWHLVAE